jgi:cytoskeletal protein CcmA (bactofilin family)
MASMLGQWIRKKGQLYVTGNLKLDEVGLINDNIYARGNIHLGRTIIVGWIYADGNVTLRQDAEVQGEVYASRDIKLGENVAVKGNVYAGGIIKTSQKSTITGNCVEAYTGSWPLLPNWTTAYLKLQSQRVSPASK